MLKNRLLKEIDPQQDSLRIYYLGEDTKKDAEHHGIKEPVDLIAPLIL